MEPLPTSRRVLTWLCIYPANETTSAQKKLVFAAYSLLVILALVAADVSSWMFYLKFVSVDLETSLMADFQIFGFAMELYIFPVMLLSRLKVKSTFESLAEIYDASKNPDAI